MKLDLLRTHYYQNVKRRGGGSQRDLKIYYRRPSLEFNGRVETGPYCNHDRLKTRTTETTGKLVTVCRCMRPDIWKKLKELAHTHATGIFHS